MRVPSDVPTEYYWHQSGRKYKERLVLILTYKGSFYFRADWIFVPVVKRVRWWQGIGVFFFVYRGLLQFGRTTYEDLLRLYPTSTVSINSSTTVSVQY